MIKNFPILQGRVYIIELPEDNRKVWLTPPDSMGQMAVAIDLVTTSFHYLPAGNWQIVGRLPEITKEQAAGMVDSISVFCTDGTEYRGWRNYLYRNDFDEETLLTTALESLESAIVAEGYYLDENPKRIKDHDFFYDGDGRLKDEELYIIECESEAETQSRVLCRERCLILRRVDG